MKSRFRSSNKKDDKKIDKKTRSFAKEKKLGFKKIFGFFVNLFGKKSRKSLSLMISHLVDQYEKEGLISFEEKNMFKNIANFGDKKVFDIMTPRADVIAISKDSELEDVKKLVNSQGHTRMPVYEKNLDEVIGFIHAKDLAKFLCGADSSFKMQRIMRKILFVPASMKLSDLLMRMRMTRIHIAVVLDEFGGVDGLVTIEDVVEEIVGNIEDEHDLPSQNSFFRIKEINKNIFQFGGRVEIEKFEEIIKMKVKANGDDYETVSGFVTGIFNRIPQKGEKVKILGLQIKILDADEKVVKLVEIEKEEEQNLNSN
jgi:CBS domain containing-hemolysin-like protein